MWILRYLCFLGCLRWKYFLWFLQYVLFCSFSIFSGFSFCGTVKYIINSLSGQKEIIFNFFGQVDNWTINICIWNWVCIKFELLLLLSTLTILDFSVFLIKMLDSKLSEEFLLSKPIDTTGQLIKSCSSVSSTWVVTYAIQYQNCHCWIKIMIWLT